MNALAHAGYNAALTTVESPRDAEARILSALTARMTAAVRTQDFSDLVSALHANERFWTHIAADLSTPGNKLPDSLRAQMITIAGFVLRFGSAVRAGTSTAQPLIDINTSIIEGLRATQTAA